MKKLIAITVVVILHSPLFAQLNISATHSKVEKIGTLRSTYSWVYNQDTDYYLCMRTTNQFDDNTLFCLGELAESAIQTASDIIKLIKDLEVDVSVEVKDSKGQEALFIKKKVLGSPFITIRQENRAGTSNITINELESAIHIIKEHAGLLKEEQDPGSISINSTPENGHYVLYYKGERFLIPENVYHRLKYNSNGDNNKFNTALIEYVRQK